MSTNHVIGYVRVSTTEQGNSVELQIQKIEAYCTMRDLVLAGVFVDEGVSGSTKMESRPAGKQALEAMADVDGVVIMKLDRAWRSASDALNTVEAWEKAGKALHIVDMGGQTLDTSTAGGKVFFTMLAGFAEFERKQIVERTTAVKRQLAAQGRYMGGQAPYGKRTDETGQLVDDPHEQAVLALVSELRRAGLSWRKVAAELESRGITTRKGGPFTASGIRRSFVKVAA